jgi:hypothetical protein
MTVDSWSWGIATVWVEPDTGRRVMVPVLWQHDAETDQYILAPTHQRHVEELQAWYQRLAQIDPEAH